MIAALVVGLVLVVVISEHVTRRGVSRREFLLGTVVLAVVGVFGFAAILGARFDLGLHLEVTADSWLDVVGPVVVVALLVAAAWGRL